jgi:Cu(I)/Ag(I) efflux system membrane protein CusA/SilA
MNGERALQDWYVKFALQTVPGVAEVASFGFEKQYQLVLDPLKMQYYNVSMMEVMKAVKTSNNDVGGRKFEMSNMAYIVRGLGYIKTSKMWKKLPKNYNSVPVKLKISVLFKWVGIYVWDFDANGEGEVWNCGDALR